ncbi:Ig-like domain-containing protein [Microbacterium halophytorum]|uniref:Ig-like domain-containing protein n=1 Tax=Microbacterium halophytorum TaxID=2067568 RepID=UPI000CFBBF4A|nr:Ig-like domain-containing protein [Microbacterium halophytorum]
MTTTRTDRRRPGAAIAAAAVVLAALVAPTTPALAEDSPVNVALASGENAPSVDVSYVTSWNSARALNNGITGPTDDYTEMWGTWGAPDAPAQDTATYTWESPVTVSSSTLHLWQNHLTGDSGVMIPDAWHIEYLDDGEWSDVVAAEYPLPALDPDAPTSSQPPVSATFDEVTTTGLRLSLDRANVDGELRATSLIEWEVWGRSAPPEEPEPDDPGAFIDAEQVAIRTETGSAPALPDEVWVTQENGPLAYVPVVWDEIAPEQYGTAGSFEVSGDPDGYEGQAVTAEVHVADVLSDAVVAIDYTSALTTPGEPPVLPRTVRAHYEDQTISSTVLVEWGSVDEASYAEAGAFFDVAGAVTGYGPGAIATVFVVEPATQTTPVVSLSFDAAAPGSGWYTTAPTASISVEDAGSPISTVEYSLDGDTWHDYGEPFIVDAQGDVTVTARATDADGGVGEDARSIRIDTVAPETGIDVEIVDGTSALVTLSPSDAEPGSGVTRTVWSDGPDADPEGEGNNFFATYEDPFSVQLTEEPRYVHVQTQDAAGNLEAYQTVELPTLGGEEIALDVEANARCVAGRAVLAVSVTNSDDAAVRVELAAEYGERRLELRPGATGTRTFTIRNEDLPAGEVAVTAASGDRSHESTVAYDAHSCR